MPIPVTVESSISVEGVRIAGARSITSGNRIQLNEDIPANQTNLQVALAFNYTKLKAYQLLSDVDMTLEFNNSTTGVPTVTLKAGVAQTWHDEMAAANIFTANVTTLYVTNTTAGNLRCDFFVDPT
jgi:hypothetical protein